MKDGLYFVNFSSNRQDFGNGVVAIQNNSVNGGDFGYYYQGKIAGDKLDLVVTRHNDQATSVFGPAKQFILNLKIAPVMGFTLLEGSVEGNPQLQIQIRAKHLADLV